MSGCIFHEDKVHFDSVRKGLQRLKVVPREYGPRLAMAVCSCRRKGKSELDVTTDDISWSRQKLYEEIQKEKWTREPETKTFTEEILNSPLDFLGRRRFIHVLSRSLENDYRLLQQEMKPRDPNTIKEKKHYVSAKGLSCIIKRKMMRYPVRAKLTLPIFGGNSKILENEAGKGFCKFGKRFDCVVRLNGEETKVFMDSKDQKTVVDVWCRNESGLNLLNQELVKAASKIQKDKNRQQEHRIRVREETKRLYSSMQRTYNPEHRAENVCFENEIERKHNLSDDYAKKNLHSHKHSTHHRQDKSELSPLKGGHCLNCLQPFTSLRSLSENICIYHPGYIVGRNFTCCSLSLTDHAKPTHEMHAGTGCRTKRHVWRQHQKASRGDKSERSYWQRVFKRNVR